MSASYLEAWKYSLAAFFHIRKCDILNVAQRSGGRQGSRWTAERSTPAFDYTVQAYSQQRLTRGTYQEVAVWAGPLHYLI